MKRRRITFPLFLIGCIAWLFAASCSDETTSTYSTKYRVMCGFAIASYAELQTTINNPGQFATIRKSGSKILMQTLTQSHEYNMDALSAEFQFGLGGLIVGTDSWINLRAYDLACPNCDRNDRRLTLQENGEAKCGKCGIVYDLNNDGVILDKGNGLHDKPRRLYRYRITPTGTHIHISN